MRKLLRLISLQYSRFFHQELPIAIEVFLMTLILSCSITPFLNTLYLDNLTRHSVPDSLHIINVSNQPISLQKLSASSSQIVFGSIDKGSGICKNVPPFKTMGYSSFLLNTIPMPLKEGQWFSDSDETIFPIVVGGRLRNTMRIGQSYEIEINVMDLKSLDNSSHTVLCTVIGHLADQCTYLGNTSDNSSSTTNGVLSITEEDLMLYRSPPEWQGEYAFKIYALSSDTKIFEDQLNNLSQSARIVSKHLLLEQAWDDTVSENRIWYVLFISTLFFMVINLLCHAVLQVFSRQDRYRLYLQCGATLEKAVIISLLPNLMLGIASYLLALLAATSLREQLYNISLQLTAIEATIPLLAFFAAYFPCSLLAVSLLKKQFPAFYHKKKGS